MMTDEERRRQELIKAGKACGLPPVLLGRGCQADRDGDCIWFYCPQLRDEEPGRNGRSCPLDLHKEERSHQ